MSANILVVEDERVVAMDIKNSLTKLGYQVSDICARAEEAVSKCFELRPELVLMDIRLKGEMDGISAAQEIKDKFSIPVVYLTAHADEKTLERAKVTEPFGYLVKPFETVELYVAIELALHKCYGDDVAIEKADNFSEAGNSEQFSFFADSLLALPEFKGVLVDSISSMFKSSYFKNVAAGELIAFEGDERSFGILPVSGRISLFKSSLSGRELIVEILSPYELFGLAMAIEDQPYDFSARAQIDSQIFMVPKKGLISLLEKEHVLYRRFINLISERLARAHDVSRGLAHDKVDVRIASALLAVLPKNASNADEVVCITRKELAELAGTTVETAIRVTKSMEREQLLDLSTNGRIRIPNRSRVESFAESS